MSAPVSAAQIAQQKLQDPAAQQLKQGASKFDQTLATKGTQATGQVDAAQKAQSTQATQATTKTQAAQATQSTQATQSVTKADQVRHTETVQKSERASMRRIEKGPAEQAAPRAQEVALSNAAPAATKPADGAGMMVKMIGDLEKGQGVMDKLIQMGLSGKHFSSSELIALQAGMYKYTQELELTGKVVEKATSGLKDTLKTQV
jgi:hypothetical protein